nr:SpaA isopeptide-forming pilin-related protein [Enterococcus sp. MJM16]
MWVQSDSSQRDTSREVQRSSAGQVQLYQIQQIVLTKEVDKSLIEVGEKDDADLAASSDITYKITLENYSSDKLSKVNVLDVLPYNGDSFGSNFDGSYTVKNIKIVEGSGTINYTTDAASEKTDPNDVYGWGLYVPGNSEPAIIKNAKGFLVSTEELSIGDKLAFEVTISVQGQKTANIYRNRATFNSHLKLPVNSNIVQTQVLSRDLTGYVWYDDNYNGVIESNEDPVGDIPVKLYRTSLVNSSYEKQLVKESLTGQKFVDGSGNSLIKTKTTGQDKGKYQFPDLPEGEYLAEFMVGDIVVTKKIAIVTKQLVGSDPKLNSKADPDTFKTPEYNHPVLKDLPTLLTGTDKVHHVTDVNAGLTRLSKIKLFKYEEGTVIDTNGDGKLSDAEIEASSTNALKGAEFQLYKGDSDNPDPADKIGDPVKTDSDGWLEFSSLPPGDYTIIETKAPDGFELLKDPIKVTVPTYNHIAIVHVPDKGQTELPFTGGTKAMRFILIGAASLLVIGMTGVFLHFRPIKGRGGN